jgi:DNA-binding winged helix-turn-helix (wHTH) protein/Tol biopolymer transport system component
VLYRAEFGPFTLDHRAFELRRKGYRIRISASLFKLLALFVERPGELITREQIVACLWDQPEYVDVDSGINSAVNRLRLILGDNSAKPVYLETVVGAGYRFKMPVQRLPETNSSQSHAEPPPQVAAAVIPPAMPSPVLEPPTIKEEAAVSSDTGSQVVANIGEAGSNSSLLSAVEGQPVEPHPGAWGGVSLRRLLPIAGFVLLAAVCLVAWQRQPAKQVGAELGETPAFFSEATFNEEGNPVTTQAMSHNGQWIAYSDSRGLFCRDLRSSLVMSLSMPAGLEAQRLTWQVDDHALLVSGVRAQDGGSIPEVWLIPIAGEAEHLLVRGGSDAVASPDGKQLAYVAAHGTEVWSSSPTGASPRRLRAVGAEYDLHSLEWAPTSDRLIVDECRHASLGDPRVDLQGVPLRHCTYESINAATGAILASEPETSFDSAFLTADDRLYFSRDVLTEESSRAGLFTVSTDPVTGRFLSAPRLVFRLPGDEAFGISASGGGQLMSALIRRRSSDVFVGDLSFPGPRLSHIQQLEHMAPDNYPHAWTPDGRQVLFESNDMGEYAIYQQGVDGSAAHLLARAPQSGAMPRLSPDHRSVFFENFAFRPGAIPEAIFQVPLAGGEIRQLPLRGRIEDFDCPYERAVQEAVGCVVRERTGNDFSFFRFDPLKGEGPLLVKAPVTRPLIGNWSLSSDGTEVAIPGDEPTRPEIMLVPLSGKDSSVRALPVHLTNPGVLLSVAYSPRGDGFYAQVRTGTGYDLSFIDRSGRAIVLRQTAVPTWGVPSLDGKKLAFVDQTSNTNAWVGTVVVGSANLEEPVRYAPIGSILDGHGN